MNQTNRIIERMNALNPNYAEIDYVERMNANGAKFHGIIEYIERMINKGIQNNYTHVVKHELSTGVIRYALVFVTDILESIEGVEIEDFQLMHIDVTLNVDNNIKIELFASPQYYHAAPYELLYTIGVNPSNPNYADIGYVARLVFDYLNSY
jgi:hypothetical protein